jgi:hypothetical protein
LASIAKTLWSGVSDNGLISTWVQSRSIKHLYNPWIVLAASGMASFVNPNRDAISVANLSETPSSNGTGKVLIAGCDKEKGPQLYHAEPSGTFYRYDAKAIGSGSEGAQAELNNEYHKSLSLKDAELLALKILKQVMEEKLDCKNAQLASVTESEGFKIYSDEKTDAIIKVLNEQATDEDTLMS